MRRQVIILNGPAGVGKTTVGRRLAGLAPNGACVHGDCLREFVVSRVAGEVAGGLAYVNGAAVAATFLRAGYERVVVEFVFEHPRHVRRFMDAFPLPVPVHLFTLWAPLEVVIAREAARPDRARLGARVAECHRAIAAALPDLGLVVESGDLPAERVARRIDGLCREGVGLVGGPPPAPPLGGIQA